MNYDKKTYDKAFVYVNNQLYMEIDLSDEIYREYTVETENGINLISVHDGAIGVIKSDCPDKICIKTGFISDRSKPIICIPHKLEIIIGEKPFLDGVV